jgi:hypothetical protein
MKKEFYFLGGRHAIRFNLPNLRQDSGGFSLLSLPQGIRSKQSISFDVNEKSKTSGLKLFLVVLYQCQYLYISTDLT